jgi:uncharacterized repeat protein (TIGR03803 family)
MNQSSASRCARRKPCDRIGGVLVGWLALFVLLSGIQAGRAAAAVTFEAEAGVLGADFTNGISGATQFISIATPNVNSGHPGTAARVVSCNVVFPTAGTYNLYARLRVGGGGFNDDSMFYGNGFGAKSPTIDNDWQLVNGLAAGGFTAANDVVTGNGTAGNQVWKWVNVSQFNPSGSATETPITFTVPSGNLSQTFQFGAREDGLELDKFVFGIVSNTFTVTDLDNGTDGTPLPASSLTNTFVGPAGNALHRFNPLSAGLNLDGANPVAGLALFWGGLVGTTLNGGPQGGGTAFWMSADGTNFNAFRAFTNAPDAGHPRSELAFAAATFFTATSGGGAAGVGAVIAGQTNGSVSLLRSFAAVNADNATNSGGANPNAALASSGVMLFGTTTSGGAAGNGTIYSLTTNGATFSVLRNFSALDLQTGTNADGAQPQGGVILSGDTLYGTAAAGGVGGSGVVFSIRTNGANFTALHSFTPLDPLAAINADGAMPLAGLVFSNGTLYGTSFAGGTGGAGTVFALQTNGTGFTVLHHFAAVDSVTRTNTEGATPAAPLLLSSNLLYGTASAGGNGAAGTVFSLKPDGTQFRTIHSFAPLAATGTNVDGAFSVAPLVRLGNTLYGTASGGGPGGVGTVFAVTIPPAPAIITNIIRNANNTVTLHFVGGPLSTNIIQFAPNLLPPVAWQNLATNLADANGLWQFTDGINPTTRFYRSYAR